MLPIFDPCILIQLKNYCILYLPLIHKIPLVLEVICGFLSLSLNLESRSWDLPYRCGQTRCICRETQKHQHRSAQYPRTLYSYCNSFDDNCSIVEFKLVTCQPKNVIFVFYLDGRYNGIASLIAGNNWCLPLSASFCWSHGNLAVTFWQKWLMFFGQFSHGIWVKWPLGGLWVHATLMYEPLERFVAIVDGDLLCPASTIGGFFFCFLAFFLPLPLFPLALK